ncbi:OPT-domain-containing protein [Hyphopichia burtonii NRRL Y-1933]|uniref:OPT-domain-containing protein n=1 Tax=Hyphopichia burtonii NRRL Y-1933 TaxID=984485 RepID=A0A1E4RGG6_9ASCO|nr:OPT-domain-containing protein [Hyphopichia burtonii NRRL Y-1933]ODV66348.1 OPT-domain-containing protein [Hyphopichia burtonii NRRL Y-1933]
MLPEKSLQTPGLSTVRSASSHLSVDDHEVDLEAIQSQAISIGEVAGEFTSEQKYFILRRLNYEGLVNLNELPVGATFMLEKISALNEAEAVEILKEYIEAHYEDVNIPDADYQFAQKLIDEAPNNLNSGAGDIKTHLKSHFDAGSDEKQLSDTNVADSTSIESITHSPFELFDWSFQVRVEAGLIAYHSPYPEIRAVTEPYDDPSVPCETPRAIIVGIIWLAIGVVINQFFYDRQPNITFTSAVAQLFIYPSGKLLALILPKWSFTIWKHTIDLNPGPWNEKEQMLATLIFSIAGGTTSYVTSNITVQKMARFYDNKWVDFGYQVLLILSTNFMGFGFAGLIRKFVIYPTRSIWPSILPTLAVNKALMKPEKHENINGWTISRYTWFFSITLASFLYYWIPDYLFQALSSFNWMTWIKPDNFNLASITGSESGLGFNPIPSFDWNVINYNACLTVPFFSYVNQYIGSIIAFFAIVGVYWSNYYWASYLPINSNSIFTNTGEYYAVTEVLNSNNLLDKQKYDKVGPPFYSAANLVLYGAFFAIYPFAFFYEVIMNYKAYKKAFIGIYKTIRNFKTSTYEGFNDPHSRMMARYKEVPEWCFLCVLVISIVLAILCVELYPTETPVWGIFFAVGINFVFLIPITTIYSVTGFLFGLNVLVELIVGYALPGNGLALMFIKALGYNIDGQADNFISNQKMGHYAKVPPRAMFRWQIVGTFIASFIGLGIINFTIDDIKDYCEPGNKLKFTCPQSTIFYSSSILWGVIGPKRVFNQLYPILRWCFLIGFLLVFPCVAFKKYGPKKAAKYFQPTLIIGGFLIYAPYNLSYYTGGLYMSIAFMWYLRSRYTTWWEKYNYVLSGGLDAGVAFSAIIIFFAVQYHDKSITWWGNTVSTAGLDGAGLSLKNATLSAPDGYFGPRMSKLAE